MKSVIVLVLLLLGVSAIGPISAQTASPGFTNQVYLSSGGDSENPQIIASNDGIFTLWEQQSSGKSDVFFKKSADGGNTFGTAINLSESTVGQSGYSDFVQQGNDVYAIWQSSISGYAEVYLAKSTDGGSSFEKPMILSNQSKLAAFPQVAMSENHVYATWLEKSDNNATNVVFVKSDDKAKSFGNPSYITSHAGNSGIPKLLAGGNNVYVLWEDNRKGNFEIFLSKSDDNGVSFSSADISNTAGQSGAPQIIVSKDHMYVVWMDDSSGNYDIMFSKSTDGGKSFSQPVNVSKLHTDSGYPQLAVYGNNVYVTWTQTIVEPNYDVYLAKSSNNGDTYDTPINLSHNNGASGWPNVLSDGNVYVSWVDSSHGKFDVLITKSVDGGNIFENATNVSSSAAESYESQMAALNNQVFMVWQEGPKGNHAISFSKSTTFVPEFGPFALIAFLISIIAIIGISAKSNLRLKAGF